MPRDLAVVLNNGSVNSAVVTALAAQKFRPILLHVDYGLESMARWRGAYDAQVQFFKPYREHSFAMPFLATLQHGASQGIQQSADPRIQPAVPPSLVELIPLVGVAARLAVHYSAAAVYLGYRAGTQADELAQAIEYAQIWNEMLQLPCAQPDLGVEVPLLEMEPWQVVDLGFQVTAPLDRTWSCLEGGNEPCFACRGCRSRESAFVQAGKPDPLRVVKRVS
jgi:7-cyano-7-deazaguanine synthase